ncbi:MAG: four helix bundle protein [Bacteroidota bacterium]
MAEKKNELLKVTFELALKVIDFCELLESKRKYVIARQLLKAGTSIGANSQEAQGAESRADFIHKIKIAYKEAKETAYWLTLCQYSQYYPTPPDDLQKLSTSAKKILGKILSTAKQNQNRER